MASIPQFYSNYSFSNDFFQFPNPLLTSQENCIGGVAIPSAAKWGEEISFPMFLDNEGLDVFQKESNLTSSVPAALPDNNVAGFYGIGTIQNYGGIYQLKDVCEFGEECSGFAHQCFKPVYPTVRENWV